MKKTRVLALLLFGFAGSLSKAATIDCWVSYLYGGPKTVIRGTLKPGDTNLILQDQRFTYIANVIPNEKDSLTMAIHNSRSGYDVAMYSGAVMPGKYQYLQADDNQFACKRD